MGLKDNIIQASRDGDLHKLEDLFHLNPGKIVNCQDAKSGRTPLHLASLNGHFDCVGFLLSHFADPNVMDDEGSTALHLAASEGHNDVAGLLISRYSSSDQWCRSVNPSECGCK